MTRRAYRITLLTMVVALILAWSLGPVMFKQGRGYEFLERYPVVCRVARVGFVLAGRDAEFDQRILMAWYSRRDREARERELMTGDE
jgi:hypothetical protein